MRYEYAAVCGDSARRMLDSTQNMTVIAVHSQSVYMRAQNGRLLLLCPDTYGSVPFGVAMPDFHLLREEREFCEGEEIFVERGCLRFSDGSEISISRIESNYIPDISRPSIPDISVMRFCSEFVYRCASERGIAPSLPAFLCMGTPRTSANVYALGAAAEADRLEWAFESSDEKLLSDSIRKFVGLGYGLTPSGDDFISGMAYAFHRYKGTSDRSSRNIAMMRRVVPLHYERTSEVSREYLVCALDGEHFEVVDRVLDCLCSGADMHTLEDSMDRLLTVGASSGSDILCGILFALYILS